MSGIFFETHCMFLNNNMMMMMMMMMMPAAVMPQSWL